MQGIDSTIVNLGDGADRFRVEDTIGTLEINTGGGLDDRVELVSVRHPTTVRTQTGLIPYRLRCHSGGHGRWQRQWPITLVVDLSNNPNAVTAGD